MIKGIDEMLFKRISFSLYMTHGGTCWGHWAGANSPGFAPGVTSYDYDAPISESGRTTESIYIPAFSFTEMAPLFENLPLAKKETSIRTMEEYNQGLGNILYRTILPEVKSGTILTVNDAHDYAQVFVDGKPMMVKSWLLSLKCIF